MVINLVSLKKKETRNRDAPKSYEMAVCWYRMIPWVGR